MLVNCYINVNSTNQRFGLYQSHLNGNNYTKNVLFSVNNQNINKGENNFSSELVCYNDEWINNENDKMEAKKIIQELIDNIISNHTLIYDGFEYKCQAKTIFNSLLQYCKENRFKRTYLNVIMTTTEKDCENGSDINTHKRNYGVIVHDYDGNLENCKQYIDNIIKPNLKTLNFGMRSNKARILTVNTRISSTETVGSSLATPMNDIMTEMKKYLGCVINLDYDCMRYGIKKWSSDNVVSYFCENEENGNKCGKLIESILDNTKEIVLTPQQYQLLSCNELWNIREVTVQTKCCVYLDCHNCDKLYVYSSNQHSLQKMQTLLDSICKFENVDKIHIV